MSTDVSEVARGAADLMRDSLQSLLWTPLPHQIPPSGDWYGWLLLAGRGCVAPWTRIYDPVTGGETPVSELARRGNPITVLGLGHDGAVPVRCDPPFVKGYAEWIRFVMDDGSEVTVTADHRFLTPSGWRSASGLLSGHLLGCAPGPRPSSSVSGSSASERLRPVGVQNDGPWMDDTSWKRVASKQIVGYGQFYDLQVPDVHSYLAEGVWHHNSGKTDTCAKYIVDHVKGPPCLTGDVPHWMGIIAPTLGDAATSCFSGPSGIRAHDPSARLVSAQGGAAVRWPNGSEAKLFGAHTQEDVERLRSGGNRCLAWLEEVAAWRHLDQAWDHMRFGLRVGPRPHWIGSTTPKPRPLIKRLERGAVGNVVVTRASMYDNPHLSQGIRDALEETYGGTQLGRQELLGHLVDEDENALWSHASIDAARVSEAPDLIRITVGVDPSGGAGEQGIVVSGKSAAFALNGERPVHHGYVLDDRTCHLSPDGWGRRAVQAAVDWQADDILVETNYGGAMAVSTLRAAAEAIGVSIPVRTVTATRGKAVRAQPVSALTAQKRWHHVGTFEALEDQMCTWTPESGYSPDRLDAMVWGAWGLRIVHTSAAGVGSFGGQAVSQVIVPGARRVS